MQGRLRRRGPGRPSRRSRRLGRVSVGVAATSGALLLATVLTSAPAAGQATDRPLLWDGRARAAGVHLAINTDPRLLPLEDLIVAAAPDGQTVWSNAQATARASSYYPGTSGTGGPGLLCDFGFPCDRFPQPFPPPYPLTARAQYPTQTDDQTDDGIARAHAGDEQVTSFASMSDNARGNPIAPLAPVLAIGEVESRTAQEFVDGVLTVTATSHLSDVAIAGGEIRIASIDAVSVSRADGESPPRTETTFTVQGVTAQGHPATITERGITIDTASVGGEQREEAQRQLNAFLAERDVRIRLVDTVVTDEQARTSGEATGLFVDLAFPLENPTGQDLPSVPLPPEVPVPGDPNQVFRTYLVTTVLGSAGTSAFASNDPFALGGPVGGALPAAPGGAAAPSGGGLGTAFPPADTGTTAGGPAPLTAPPPATSGAETPPVAAPHSSPAAGGGLGEDLLRLLGIGGDLADVMEVVYLATTLGGVGLFALSRLVPAASRRPAVVSRGPRRA